MKPTLFTEQRPFTVLTLLISLATLLSVEAQSVDVRLEPVRVTFADSGSDSISLTNFLDFDTNVVNPVTLTISGLPAGVTASYTSLTLPGTNDFSTNLVLNATSVAQGEYTINLNATGGATNTFLLTLQSGRMWTGDTNVTTDWSSAASWIGGVAPGTTSDVLFTQLGAQTNITGNFSNSVVSTDTEIASLRFSQTNGGARFHTISISPGRTLSVTGSKGFKMLRDSTSDASGNSQMNAIFVGSNGRMVVSNQNANFSLLAFNENNQITTLDMAGLGTFVADVNRLPLGDFLAFPNYTNLAANNFGNATFRLPRKFLPTVRLARTNIITAHSVDPNNYMDPSYRYYSLTIGNNENSGTTTKCNLHFGISNLFLMDSICFVQSGAQAMGNNLVFNPNLVVETIITAGPTTNFVTNACSAYFRNTNGTGRMSVFSISDGAGPGVGNTGVKGILDFTAGTVNALVDRLYMGRERTNSDGAPIESTLSISRGIFDVNTAIIGFQGQGNNQGWTNADPRNYCRGTLNLSSNAVFKANKSLELGYTTADIGATNGSADQGFGQITIAGGATLMASNILVGGVTKLANPNTITTTGGNLIVSNQIATSDKWLTTLNMSGVSTLTLHLNGANPPGTHYVYATNLTIAANQILTIPTTVNLSIPPSGTNIPLFMFVNGGGANFTVVNLPAPMRGTVVPGATLNENDLNIITNAPKNLVWRGPVSTWNVSPTNKNWRDTATGLLTNYINGDVVTFDDFAGVPTTVTIGATLIPDSITVSNSANSFVFSSGGGAIVGGSLVKNGSGTLDINVSTSIPLQVSQGKLQGNSSGAASSVSVASGAILDFSGTINPSGLTCAGTATVRGTTVGALLIQSGGIVTNTGTTMGAFNTESGALLVNSGTLGGSVSLGLVGIGSSTVVSNAVFINDGAIGTPGAISTLTVSGVFKDTGAGGLIYLTTLTINGGSGTNNNNAGTFIPGGDGIGTTIIRSPGVGAGTFLGRVSIGTGSTNIFKVNVDSTPVYTILRAPWIDFGPSVGTPSFNGGFLWVTNVGASSLSAGQSFGMFTLVDGSTPIQFGSTNAYPIMVPTVPGPGLTWNLNDLRLGGVVAVRGVGTTPTNIVQSASFTTRTNNAGVTNLFLVSHLSWPSNYTGWHVEQQSSTRGAGMTTNWDPNFDSYFTNQIFLTNQVTSNGIGFFRMAFP